MLQWYDGKLALQEKNKKNPDFVAFANVGGVNTLALANFILPVD